MCGADLHHIDTASVHDRKLFEGKRNLFDTLVGRGVDFRDAKIYDCHFQGLDLSGSDFRGATIKRCFFADYLDDAHFDGSNILDSTLAIMNNATFDRAKLTYCDLRSGLNVSFKGCKMRGLSFFCGVFQYSDFSGATICHGEFGSADLRHSNFRNAVLFRCGFEHTKLADVDYHGMTLSGCASADNDVPVMNWSHSPVGWVERGRRRTHGHEQFFSPEFLRFVHKHRDKTIDYCSKHWDANPLVDADKP